MAHLVAVTTAAQIGQVVRLAAVIWKEHYIPIIGPEQVEYMLEKFQSAAAIQNQINQGYDYCLVEQGGSVVGYAGVLAEPDKHALFLSKVYMDSTVRGQGIGRAVMQQLFDGARERGLERAWLTVNKHNVDAIRAYEKLGFVQTGSVVMDIGDGFVMDDYRMELALV